MLTYLHDIRNKLTLISGHTTILSKKFGEDDFIPIRTNLLRISELVNDAYRSIKEKENNQCIHCSPAEFSHQMDLLTESAQLLFSITIQNEIGDFKSQKDFKLEIDIGKTFQVIENAIDNALKAGASKLLIRLLEVNEHCIYEIVDNGMGKSHAIQVDLLKDNSVIPHGIGKEIMMKNMMLMGGKVEWTNRLDNSGMIVRLYFPKKS